MVGYGPNEGDGEEIDRTLDNIGNGYRLCILGDLNGWVADRTRTVITGAFGVPGENDNGRKRVEFCEERRLCMGSTYFKYKSVHKYTKVARDCDGVKNKSMIDLVLVKRGML